jgi:hypothetical protein
MEQIAKDVGTVREEKGEGKNKNKRNNRTCFYYIKEFSTPGKGQEVGGTEFVFIRETHGRTQSTRTIYGRERHVSNAIDDHYFPE